MIAFSIDQSYGELGLGLPASLTDVEEQEILQQGLNL